ncbi:hypothetical protein AMS68_006229 [Peltaster fructicola]|uniref:UDP-N-acetylglucosamine--dolichyl-phosphate N-acetylglucosaminephosphotransferase n=1 Tax=Peltaster fructicola TaxID=286661 RepID=A0A6H0Y104_9PEZI|nr:hypothetical protein AMS68_006229 [Peltaster fructicola]
MLKPLSRTETSLLGLGFIASVAVLIKTWQDNGEPLLSSLAISGLAFTSCFALIRWTGDAFLAKGFKGKDMSKKNPTEIPEMLGLVCATVHLFAILAFLPFAYRRGVSEIAKGDITSREAYGDELERVPHLFPLDKVRHSITCCTPAHTTLQHASYDSAFCALAFATLLGLIDDIFDLRWRHKWFIPSLSALPMLLLYYERSGDTHVVVPVFLRSYLPSLIELGGAYYLYMAAIATFCPNSINMLAGVNGLEVGQCIVIALQIMLNDLLYISPAVPQPHPAAEAHLFSIYLLLPLLGVSLALLWHNWYPAKVFVGDTYCYFAGMVFAVVGILGHFSKTLLLLFVPQVFNFLYSTPQLFGLVPCPRHRLPRFNTRTGLLEPSIAVVTEDKPLKPIVGEVLKLLHVVKLIRVETNAVGTVTSTTNLTLINLWLVWRGPLREDRLSGELLLLQAAICSARSTRPTTITEPPSYTCRRQPSKRFHKLVHQVKCSLNHHPSKTALHLQYIYTANKMLSPMQLLVALCFWLNAALATDVFAHFMMQNAWSYKGAEWALDIKNAQAMGIDGFILNVIPPLCDSSNNATWQFERAYDAYCVAAYMGFKMMLSFDMSYTSCDVYWTPQVMYDNLEHLSSIPNSPYRWNTDILVTTFGGTNAPYGNSFLQAFKDLARANNFRVQLAPALTTYSNDAQQNADAAASQLMVDYPSADGYVNWQAWPLDTHANMTTAVDQAFQNKLRAAGHTGPYIMSVSPWQYKDLDNSDKQDSWVQYSDYLFPQRWQSLVGPNAFKPDMIQLLTWNDWGESHYLRDLPSTDPLAPDYVQLGNMANYVTRMNHSAWRTIATYYITWMKSGSAPQVTADTVVAWYRTHPKGVSCASGATVPIRNADFVQDALFFWGVVTSEATISATVGSYTSSLVAYPGSPVMSHVQFPPEVLNNGAVITPEAAVMRNGGVVQWNQGTHNISANCDWENYNPEVMLVGPGLL